MWKLVHLWFPSGVLYKSSSYNRNCRHTVQSSRSVRECNSDASWRLTSLPSPPQRNPSVSLSTHPQLLTSTALATQLTVRSLTLRVHHVFVIMWTVEYTQEMRLVYPAHRRIEINVAHKSSSRMKTTSIINASNYYKSKYRSTTTYRNQVQYI